MNDNRISTEQALPRHSIVQNIIEALAVPKTITEKWNTAFSLLNEILTDFSREANDAPPFNLVQFIDKYVPEEELKKKVLNAILQEIYFGSPPFFSEKQHLQKYAIEAFVIDIFVTLAPQRYINRLIDDLSDDKCIPLIIAIFSHLREGGFYFIQTIESANFHPVVLYLIQGLQKRLFHPNELIEILNNSSQYTEDSSLQKLSDFLQNLHSRHAFEMKAAFEKLIDAVIESPRVVDNFINKDKDPSHPDRKIELITVEFNVKKSKKLFQTYKKDKYQQKEYEKLIEYFGFWAHQPPIGVPSQDAMNESFVQKCQWMIDYYSNAGKILSSSQDEMRFYLWFILKFISHLNGITQHPFAYVKGFEKLICALPTAHKNLEHLAWLPSIVHGIWEVIQLSHQLKHLLEFTNIPILVFDQSEENLFNTNARYIHKLNEKYGCNILHFSIDNIKAIAETLGFSPFIFTAANNTLGYAGARNCVLLLSPFIAKAVRNGYSNVDAIINLPKDVFDKWKKSALLGIPLAQESVIHMGDDDLFVPTANIMADLLAAIDQGMEYFLNHSYYIGRRSHKVWEVSSLKYVLEHPKDLFLSSEWTDVPYESGMKGTLTSPKFCLNLPLPNEEMHLHILSAYVDPFRQPLVHFGGSRYINDSNYIAAHPLIGMHRYLDNHIPYVFGTEVIKSFVDPTNTLNRLALPWNSKRNEKPKLYACFEEAIDMACDEKNIYAMQQIFWHNINDLFDDNVDRVSIPLRMFLNALTSSNHWQEDIDSFLKTQSEDSLLKDECNKILSIYQKYRLEALAATDLIHFVVNNIKDAIADKGISLKSYKLWYDLATNEYVDILAAIEEGCILVEENYHKPIHELTLAYQIYLIMKSVGAAEFNDYLKALKM